MKIIKLFMLFMAISFPAQAYDLPYVGEHTVIEAAYEDTFVYLARDHNLGYVEMVAANPGVDPWLPGAGTELVLPVWHLLPDAPRKGIVINLAEMRLYAFGADGKAPKSYPLGIGREGLETPTGKTKIVRKAKGPVWFPTARMREEDPNLPVSIGPGANNPLGAYALYLGWPQYLIHGTNRPFGIGRRVSSGCMRMYPEDIEKLFGLIPAGTSVTVVDQSLKVAWIGDELFLEINPSVKQANQLEDIGVMDVEPLSGDFKAIIEAAAGDQAVLLDWDQVADIVARRSSYPERILVRGIVDADANAVTDVPDDIIEVVQEAQAEEDVVVVLPTVFDMND